MRETQYQVELIKRIRELLPGCVILKNDPKYVQGVPDILILYRKQWAMLEVKMGDLAHIQPNQEFYIETLNEMSFASFINPDTEEDVLNELQRAFGTRR